MGKQLIENGHIRHSLFFAHLALEKLLKALICRQSQDFPPRIHNLTRLVELLDLSLSNDQQDFLASMNAFNIEGRYPVPMIPLPSITDAKARIAKTEEMVRWLINRL